MKTNKQKKPHLFQQEKFGQCQGISPFRMTSLVQTEDPILLPESHLTNYWFRLVTEQKQSHNAEISLRTKSVSRLCPQHRVGTYIFVK